MSEQRQQLANNLLNILQQRGKSKGISDIPLPMRRPSKLKKDVASVESQEELGDLEMRADLDPFLASNPLAKLGFKLFEDDKLEIVGVPTDKKFREKVYEASPKYQGLRGLYFKDKESVDSESESNFLKNLQKYDMDTPEFPEYGLATYAFMRDILPPEVTKRTMAHELTHAGIEYLYRNMDNFSDEDQSFIQSAIMFDGRRSYPMEETLVDRMEFETVDKEPGARINFGEAVNRANMLAESSPIVKFVEDETPRFLAKRIASEKPGFRTARMKKLYEIAEKELRKMDVPEKQGQLGTLDKVKRYFEGIF